MSGPLLLSLAFASAPGTETALAATTDPVSQILVGVVLVGVFALLAVEAAHRVLVVFSAVALLWVITYLTPWHLITFEEAQAALDLNVLFLLASMMAIVGVLKSTGVFGWSVARLVTRAGGDVRLLLTLILWFTAGLSAMVDNVTTVIFMTPMALVMARRIGLKPEVLLLPMILASNIGGTATLIGDPPNILIGSAAGLSFLAFLTNLAIPVILMMLMLDWYTGRTFGKELFPLPQGDGSEPETTITDPVMLRAALIISGGVFLGFLTHSITRMPAAIPAVVGAATILIVQDLLYLRRSRPSATERAHGMLRVIEREIEWPTLSFFAFLFIAVGAATQTGLIATLANGLVGIIAWGQATFSLTDEGTLLLASLLILWVSALVSALIDNIPFVAVTIPIVALLTTQLQGDTVALWWALSLGACLGGNGSPIGASANVTVLGLAERAGTRISFGAFLRYSIPMTLVTLLVSTLFLAGHVLLGPGQSLLLGALAAILILAYRRSAGKGTSTTPTIST